MTSAWIISHKYDKDGARLADGHYSRRTPGSPQFMPPGETIVLVTAERDAIWGWWRPHPRSGIVAMNKLDGWTCSIFRNTGGEGRRISSWRRRSSSPRRSFVATPPGRAVRTAS